MINKNSNYKDYKVYIAGHRGLVGSAIKRELGKNSYDNLIFRTSHEIDLRRQELVENFICTERPDWVFLSAAKVGGIFSNMSNGAEFIYNNLSIGLNVIHAAYKNKVKKLLNMGSSCIYPKYSPQPMKEEYLLSGILEPTNEAYSIAKISAIKLCKYYNEQYKTNFISVMPTNVYGINDNFNLETAHVIPALIRKFHLAKLLKKRDFTSLINDIKNRPVGFNLDTMANCNDEKVVESNLRNIGITKSYINLWGTGEAYREFLYVDDLSKACVFLMENYDYGDIGEFINIGTGIDIKLNALSTIIKDIVGFDGEVKYDISKPDGMARKLLDVSRIKALGWEAETDLKDGLKNVYEWYTSNN